MNSFYTNKELAEIGFKSVGENVYISKKSSIYSPEKMTIGNDVRIDDFCILSGKITIKNFVHIAAYSALYGGSDGIEIEDFANISSRVSIYSITDDYSGETMTNPMIPHDFKKVCSKQVYIGKHVIIGSTSVVLPGCIIKEGGSFGAFSFINKSTCAWSIYAGIPVKKLRDRKKDLLILEKKFKSKLGILEES